MGNPLNGHTSLCCSSAKRLSRARICGWGSNGARRPARDMSRIHVAPSKSSSNSRFDECLYPWEQAAHVDDGDHHEISLGCMLRVGAETTE